LKETDYRLLITGLKPVTSFTGHPCSVTVQVVGAVPVFDETRPTIIPGVD